MTIDIHISYTNIKLIACKIKNFLRLVFEAVDAGSKTTECFIQLKLAGYNAAEVMGLSVEVDFTHS